MQHMIEIGKFPRRHRTARFLAPDRVHPLHYLAIEVGTA